MSADRHSPQTVFTPEAAPPGGHYVQATAWGDLVFVSGQLPVGRQGSLDPDLSFDEQARLALGNLLAVLAAAGSSPRQVLKVTAYLVGIDNWPKFNAVYSELFGEARPARAIVPVPELHHGALVEVEAIACR